MKKIKTLTIYILGIFYLNVGITHFTNPDFFLVIMPTYLHYQEFFVYLSGLFEILFGLMIIFKKTNFVIDQNLTASLQKCESIGYAVIQLQGETITTIKLYSMESVQEGSFYRKTLDSILRKF